MKLENDRTISHILGMPTKAESLGDASAEIYKMLVDHADWPKNMGVEGYVLKALAHAYEAGERRGVAREKSDIAALYPPDQWWPPSIKPNECSLTSSRL